MNSAIITGVQNPGWEEERKWEMVQGDLEGRKKPRLSFRSWNVP